MGFNYKGSQGKIVRDVLLQEEDIREMVWVGLSWLKMQTTWEVVMNTTVICKGNP
jgi:hypothetical protein